VVLRWFVAIIAALILEGGALHFLGIAADRIVPPPAAYQRATAEATGTVTGKVKLDNATMFWNSQDQWAIQYTFHPAVMQPNAKGVLKPVESPTPVSDSVLVDQAMYTATKADQTFLVKYDPDNPIINSVPGTLGVMSRSCGWLGIWLMYPGIFIVLAFVIEASLRSVIRDL
jgi:hypothetical protein